MICNIVSSLIPLPIFLQSSSLKVPKCLKLFTTSLALEVSGRLSTALLIFHSNDAPNASGLKKKPIFVTASCSKSTFLRLEASDARSVAQHLLLKANRQW
jgi:hypothetical protein